MYIVVIFLILYMLWSYFKIKLIEKTQVDIKALFLKADVKLLHAVSGLTRDWDIKINDNKVFDYFSRGTSGFFESYVKGYWTCIDLAELLRKLEASNMYELNIQTLPQLIRLGINRLRIKIVGFTEKDGKLVGLQHYDLPLQLYEKMLGPTMNYSCAYFKNTDNLDTAQIQKMDLIARKMNLKPEMTVLDIGCGWGSLANYLVVNYKVNVVAITISEEQFKYCTEKYHNENLTFLLQDYRKLNIKKCKKFNRIVSVGMFEHVTSVNYNKFFEVCQQTLKPKGLILLHTITGDKSHRPGEGNPFIMKYIFPNSQLPSLEQITKAVLYKFVVEDVQNIGLYYNKTLSKWRENFNELLKEKEIPLKDEFIRMWKAYLIMSQIGFERNRIFLHQLVLSRGQINVYEASR